ncbi:MAG: hypothetical protein ACLFSM_04560 [Thermoplasmata archaeon]
MPLELIYNLSFAVLTVLALVLSVISILAYRRSRKKKLILVSIAFILFFVKGLWLSYALFDIPKEAWGSFLIPVAVVDCLILILLYLSIVKG